MIEDPSVQGANRIGRGGPGWVRLVASGLDGTLLRSDGSIAAGTVEAVRMLHAAGVTFVVATARPPRRTLPLLADFGLGTVAICGNGSIVCDIGDGRIIEMRRMVGRVAMGIVDDIGAALPGCAFAAEMGLRLGREAGYVLNAPDTPDTLVAPGQELAHRRPSKLMVQHRGMPFPHLLATVVDVVGDRAIVSHSTQAFLELSARGVDKASALRRLCRRMGVARANVLAIGDMPNDLPMLRWAGRSVAVANAHPDVLEVVDTVTRSNDDDGVAQVLERLLR